MVEKGLNMNISLLQQCNCIWCQRKPIFSFTGLHSRWSQFCTTMWFFV